MQQMQSFPSDPYQAGCVAGIGTHGTGISGGEGKHYKVHGNVAFGNFNNYVHGDPEARGMTRIIFNGNGNRNDFQCGTDNFQNCLAGEIIDNTGNYQLNLVNANPNMRYVRQQVNPSFYGDNQMPRCYIQRPQGQQARFVGVQPGSKMRPNVSYRNFNNNQQRQKQNRRIRSFSRTFNNFKTQKANGGGAGPHTDRFFDEDDVGSSPNRRLQQQQEYQNTPEQEVERKITNHSKQENQQQTKAEACRSSISKDSYNRKNKSCREPKVEYFGDISHDLSYDDISENSDDDEDTDLRERLIRKKHDQIIKREPGELDSDEDEAEIKREIGTSAAGSKRKGKKTLACVDIPKKFKISNSSEAKSKESKKSQRSEKKDSGKQHSHDLYSCHDNRCSSPQDTKSAQTKTPTHKPNCMGSSRSFSSTYTDSSTQNYCCSDAEVTGLKERIDSMNQSLREAQDKLLETNVVASKKTLRMLEEISQLKKQLEEAAKSESDLKTSMRNVEKELAAKNAEVAKLSLMSEVEKQDKAKFSAEMNRTYKERLTIEVEKLRALFDVEVAKMQAFYLSSNIYEDDPNIPFADVSSNGRMQNQKEDTPRNEMLGNPGNNGVTVNNHVTRDVNHHREIPFMQAYFNPSSQASATAMTATTPFSLFENVMAYNSLIHHQHIYAQTTATANNGNCSQGSAGSSSVVHSGI